MTESDEIEVCDHGNVGFCQKCEDEVDNWLEGLESCCSEAEECEVCT